MEYASPSPVSSPEPAPPSEAREPASAAAAAMTEYVGYLAGWFDIGRLAAGRRLNRAGVRTSLLNDV